MCITETGHCPNWEAGTDWPSSWASSKHRLGSDALDGLQISRKEYCVAGKRKHKKGRKQHCLLFSTFLFAASLHKQARTAHNAKDPMWHQDETLLGPTKQISVQTFAFVLQADLCNLKGRRPAVWMREHHPLKQPAPVKHLLVCAVSVLQAGFLWRWERTIAIVSSETN